MNSIFVGMLGLSMLGWGDRPLDGLEISQVYFKENALSADSALNGRFDKTQGLAIGGRDISQVNDWFRFGFGGHVFQLDDPGKLPNDHLLYEGGVLGWNLEFTPSEYVSFGTFFGGGASTFSVRGQGLASIDETNYFGVATPFVKFCLPLFSEGEVNLTFSTYRMSVPSQTIDGNGIGYQPPKWMDKKISIEFVW